MIMSLPPVQNGQEISDEEIAEMERALLAYPFPSKADRQWALREFSIGVQAMRTNRQQFRAKWTDLDTLQTSGKRSWTLPPFIAVPLQWLRGLTIWFRAVWSWWTDVERFRREVAAKPSWVKSFHIHVLAGWALLRDLFTE